MKPLDKITSITIFALLPFFVNAQRTTQLPGWYISKDVQQFSNDASLKRLDESELTIKSLESPHWVISKDVQKLGHPAISPQAGNVVSKGYPMWTIAKAVNGKNK